MEFLSKVQKMIYKRDERQGQLHKIKIKQNLYAKIYYTQIKR